MARLQEASAVGDLDLRIDLRVLNTEELILSVGGHWSQRTHSYVAPGTTARVIYVHQGQAEAARWFARWLKGYLSGDMPIDCERVWSLLCAGGRRGGKSDWAMKFLAMFVVAVHGSLVFAISPTQDQTQELQDALENILPPHWYEWRGDPEWRYTLINGSRLWMRSGFKASALKRGRMDCVLLNEAHLLPEKAFAMVRGATADTGGMTLLTANPPDTPIGQWVGDYYDESKAGKKTSRLFEFDPRLNPFVTIESLEDMKEDVDEMTYRREVLGEFIPIGIGVFYNWSPRFNIKPKPQMGDVTAQFIKKHFGHEGFTTIVGCDFQLSPYQAAVIMHAYFDPDNPNGEPIIYCTDEVLVHGDEYILIDELERKGLDRTRTIVICDASGQWQFSDRKIKKIAGSWRGSFDCFKNRGWRYIYPPDSQMENNPHVIERVKVANARFKTADGKRHVYSVPENEHLNRALRLWENKDGIPHRRSEFAHFCDAATYPLWRFYPRKAVASKLEIEIVKTERSRGDFDDY